MRRSRSPSSSSSTMRAPAWWDINVPLKRERGDRPESPAPITFSPNRLCGIFGPETVGRTQENIENLRRRYLRARQGRIEHRAVVDASYRANLAELLERLIKTAHKRG